MKKLTTVLWLLLVMASISAPSFAQQTYTSPDGKFAIDLPNSYAFASNKHDVAYQFAGAGGIILLIVLDQSQDVTQGFKQGMQFIHGGLPNANVQGPVKAMRINGHRARWAELRGAVKRGSQSIALNALLGDVVLGDHVVVYETFVSDSNMARWKRPLRDAFYSLRGANEPMTGVKAMRSVKP